MRAWMSRTASIAALAIIAAATPARADGLIIPFVGGDFGGDAGQCRGVTPCSPKQWSYGLGIGFMVGGVVGFEGEIAHAPNFFGTGDARPDNYLLTAMGSLLVGVPLGPVRPYGVIGAGVIHTDIGRSTVGAFDAFANNSLAIETGGGLIGMFSHHVGLRGDLRYVRTLDDVTFRQFELDKDLQFWRGSLGVVLRF